MPLKSLNKEWDEMDPNLFVPTTSAEVTAGTAESRSVDAGMPMDPVNSRSPASKAAAETAVHIEKV